MLKRINKILCSVTLLITFIFWILLVLLDILPTLYLVVLSILLFIICFLFCLFAVKGKKSIPLFISILIEILINIVLLFAGSKVYETNDFLHKLSKTKQEEMYYYVIVKKKSSYKKIKDLNNKTLATYFVNDNNKEQVLEKLNDKVQVLEKKYNNLSTLGNDLLQNKVDAILVNDFNKNRLEETKDFKEKTKVIHTIKIPLKNKVEVKNVDITKEPFSVYISGIDTSGPINTVSRSDVNIVVTVNPKTHEILLTSIPRDYYVSLHGIDGPKDKLTHAGLYGINMSVETIEDLLSMEIDDYIRVNFDTLVSVVDKVGGVDVYSDMDFKTYKGYYFKKGYNHLDGKKALAFSRERKVFAEGDRKRGEHQEEVIRAIINKITSSKVMLTNYSSILNSLENTFETSVSTSEIKSFVKMQLEEMPSWDIKALNLDGVGSSAYTYSIPNENLYVMLPDEETVKKASETIQNLKNK